MAWGGTPFRNLQQQGAPHMLKADTAYGRASRLIGLASDLASFCRRNDLHGVAIGMRPAEITEIERNRTEVVGWVRFLAAARADGQPSAGAPASAQRACEPQVSAEFNALCFSEVNDG
ncbi:hypothetical protein [Bradyrhizobium sp. Cp5.3]|uniref:hypothetical protein n=1 Tax=Bradyrhizobium sp. Cp5.3 TaxID=443598 RepID=UPI0012EBCB0A|nr:hypothetical protein [Bradyrhizobium sp. Cp5.3]